MKLSRGLKTALWCLSLSLIGLLVLSQSSGAYAPFTLSPSAGAAAGFVQKWDLSSFSEGAIPYYINPVLSPGATAKVRASQDEIVNAIQKAFQAWEDLATASVKFAYKGLTTARAGFDGENVVTFSTEDLDAASRVHCEAAVNAGRTTLPSGEAADVKFPGQLLDCDIKLNSYYSGSFTICQDPYNCSVKDNRDIQGLLTHEIGHLLGLDHSGVASATMYGFYTLSNWYRRTLSTDDMTGVSALYPEEGYLSSRGSISGTVNFADGRPVFGAHIVAVKNDTGIVIAGVLTGVKELGPDGTPSRYSSASGDYTINGLPPGSYKILAEPLDGPGSPYLSGVFGDSRGREFVNADFSPVFYSGSVTVSAGETARNINITVGPRSSVAPNIGASSYVWDEAHKTWLGPAWGRPGTEVKLLFESGTNIVSGNRLVAGARLSFIGAGVDVTKTEGSSDGKWIYLWASIASNAALGPRLLEVTTTNGQSYFTGGLTVGEP